MTRPRHGGTLIELLVALVLLDLAILSLAAVGAVTATRLGDASRRARATRAAVNRIERLSTLPCATRTGGAAPLEPGLLESWSVERTGHTATISDSIEIAARVPERIVLRRRTVCE